MYYCVMINLIRIFTNQRAASTKLLSHRGPKMGWRIFWSYPHVSAVRETLSLLQSFSCTTMYENSVYNNRSRPCLQYQIDRYLAPYVAGYVSIKEDYNPSKWILLIFLQGKDP